MFALLQVAPIYPGMPRGFYDGYLGRNAAAHDTFEDLVPRQDCAWYADADDRFTSFNRLAYSNPNKVCLSTDRAVVNIAERDLTKKEQHEGSLDRRRRNAARVASVVRYEHAREQERDDMNLSMKGSSRLNHLLYATGASAALWNPNNPVNNLNTLTASTGVSTGKHARSPALPPLSHLVV